MSEPMTPSKRERLLRRYDYLQQEDAMLTQLFDEHLASLKRMVAELTAMICTVSDRRTATRQELSEIRQSLGITK